MYILTFIPLTIRASNINWGSVPVPEPSRELWDELVQGITASDGNLMERMESSRKSFLNEAKRTRNMALRATSMNREEAEARVYEDHETFFNNNKVSFQNRSFPGAYHHLNSWFTYAYHLVVLD